MDESISGHASPVRPAFTCLLDTERRAMVDWNLWFPDEAGVDCSAAGWRPSFLISCSSRR